MIGRNRTLVMGLTPCLQRTLIFKSLVAGEVNRASRVIESASGKGTNVARMLEYLGSEAQLLTTHGGIRGEQFLRMLKGEGISPIQIATDFETRICQTLISEEGGNVTELVEEAGSLSDTTLCRVDQILQQEFSWASHLIISGSPPPGSDRTIYAHWVSMAAEAGVKSYIDCQKDPLLSCLEQKPFLVKANEEEWGKTFNLTQSEAIEEQLKKYLCRGVEVCVMTRGSSGLVCLTGKTKWVVTHPPVKAINPIGSGDAVMAGLVHGFQSGMQMHEILTLAASCGMANTQSQVSGFMDSADIEKYAHSVSLKEEAF